MTTTARQPEPRFVDPDERASTVEVLIPEARARARRRRTIYTVLALVLLGGVALAVNGVDGDARRTGAPVVRVADGAAVGVTGSSCLPPGQLPQVPDPLIGGDGRGALIAESSAVDATSAGAPCQLVLRYGFHRFGDGAVLFKSGMVWLFSDGRIIVDTDRDGFVLWERLLTPDGVERVRSHAVAALGAPITTPEDPQVWAGETIQYGDRRYHPRNPDQFVRLFDDLSWLPVSAWVNTKPMEYVPPWYAACFESLSARLEPSAVLDLMPPRARQLLDSKAATGRYWWERTTPCTILTTHEAQLIFDEFAQAGIPREGQTGQADTSLPACNWAGVPAPKQYTCSFTFGTNAARVQVTFFALMPNGEMAMHGD